MRRRRQNGTGGERTFTVNKTTPITTVTTTLSNSTATSEEIRKMKRRQYQQKRRQSVAANNKSDLSGNLATMNVMGVTIPLAVSLANNNNQIISVATVSLATTVLAPGGSARNVNLNTSGAAPMTPTGTVASVCIPSTPNLTAKKRSRKGSKYEEIVDYDAFIEFVMAQIRTALSPLTVHRSPNWDVDAFRRLSPQSLVPEISLLSLLGSKVTATTTITATTLQASSKSMAIVYSKDLTALLTLPVSLIITTIARLVIFEPHPIAKLL